MLADQVTARQIERVDRVDGTTNDNSGGNLADRAHYRLGWSLLAATIRTARSRRSGEYLLEELPDKTGRSVIYQSSGGGDASGSKID
jgi:hypothetical protein